MMILRQAARDGLIAAAPAVSLPRQETVIRDVDAGVDDDVATPDQVEALYDATPKQLAIMVLLAAWCQLRRAECLGLQRRDIEWLADGGAILHVRRQLSAKMGDYSNELKSEAGKRSLAIPRLMLDRLEAHLRDHVAAEAKRRSFRRTCAAACPFEHALGIHLDGQSGCRRRLASEVPIPRSPARGSGDLRQEGQTLAELMRRGGHSDIRVVLRYQHATLARDRELADRMSDRIEARLRAVEFEGDEPGRGRRRTPTNQELVVNREVLP